MRWEKTIENCYAISGNSNRRKINEIQPPILFRESDKFPSYRLKRSNVGEGFSERIIFDRVQWRLFGNYFPHCPRLYFFLLFIRSGTKLWWCSFRRVSSMMFNQKAQNYLYCNRNCELFSERFNDVFWCQLHYFSRVKIKNNHLKQFFSSQRVGLGRRNNLSLNASIPIWLEFFFLDIFNFCA